MTKVFQNFLFFVKRRAFLISWISLVIYIFYKTYIYYQNGRQFLRLRNMLGSGLCISRGSATVLNLCSALVLLPLCKKLNRLAYRGLSRTWPRLFFLWLEKAKSFHMTVAVTLVFFAVIHSISHFVNLWNFSRNYDDNLKDLNLAQYKNQNPLHLILTQPGVTGLSMLLVVALMGVTSLRVIRRKFYGAFWYTHQLYMSFLVLLLIHPLSGLLKEEVIEDGNGSRLYYIIENSNGTAEYPRFVYIQSKTWQWMALPLTCFCVDLVWRLFSRNRNAVEILEATHMPGRTISLRLASSLRARAGQYVLLQAADISLMEWHPFTVVQVPTKSQRYFTVWIRVAGDWTEALERLLLEKAPASMNMLVDGPYCSVLQSVSKSDICICVAAGVGITPFVAVLRNMLMYPRSRLPGRLHLIWIVRHECELSWLAELATSVLLQLRNSNRPDRLHLQLFVTNKQNTKETILDNDLKQVVILGPESKATTVIEDEKETLLTPPMKRNTGKVKYEDDSYRVAEKFPLLGCRVRRGRPHWDRVFGYWVHLYPKEKLNLYCCGPKKLVKLLKSKCDSISQTTSTEFTFVHEGFS